MSRFGDNSLQDEILDEIERRHEDGMSWKDIIEALGDVIRYTGELMDD